MTAAPTLVQTCAAELAAAHRAGRATGQSAAFTGLTLPGALQVQRQVMTLLGEASTVGKVGINADGIGISAPIFASTCGVSGHSFTLPETGFLGIEVEIAVRLTADITPERAAGGLEAVMAAVGSFHIGVELVGTRLAQRDEAGAFAQLADQINACGYIHAEAPYPRGADLDGAAVAVSIDGTALEPVPGVNAFGHVLNPVLACGRATDRPVDTLKAGMLVTTGALSGLIPISRPATVSAGLAGFEPVRFRLVR